MSLRAMKSAQEPNAVGLARIVQELPATGLAGMGPNKYAYIFTKYAGNAFNMQQICSHMKEICTEYADICRYMHKNM